MIIGGIVAGGTGSRMGDTNLPKQLLPLNDKPVLNYSLEAFLRVSSIEYIIIGIHPLWMEYTQKIISNLQCGNTKILLAPGGSDRNETINNMVTAFKEEHSISSDDIFITHDAARPFVTQEIIEDCIRETTLHRVTTATVPASDTIVQSYNDKAIEAFPDRRTMYREQTPQGCYLCDFIGIYPTLSPEERGMATDLCKLFFLKGYPVSMFPGSENNIKVTYPGDLALAETIFNKSGK